MTVEYLYKLLNSIPPIGAMNLARRRIIAKKIFELQNQE